MKDWRSMEAGPALDRLIARYIYDIEVQPTERPLYRYLDSDDQPFGDWKSSTDMLKPPPYSTSVDAALRLIEECDGFELSIDDGPRGAWFAYADYPGYADTPALAICRAWLAYKDSKEAVHDV